MKNVVVLGLSRTRTSMIVAAFRALGWNQVEDPGSITRKYPLGKNENEKLNELFRKRGGPMHYWATLVNGPPQPAKLPRDEVESVLPPEPWVSKADPLCWPSFEPFDPVKVVVTRDFEDTVESNASKNGRLHPGQWEMVTRLVFDYQKTIPGAHFVDSDRVKGGDVSQLEVAVRAAGGDWDERKALGCVVRTT